MKLSLNSFFWETKVPAKQVHFSTYFFSSQAHVMYVFKCDWRAFILVRDFSLPLSKTDRSKALEAGKGSWISSIIQLLQSGPLLTFYNCSYGTCYIDFEHSILPCKKRSSDDHEHISLWTSLSVSPKMARSWKLLKSLRRPWKDSLGIFKNYALLSLVRRAHSPFFLEYIWLYCM